ncbi:MAG: response regulator, partial [Chloroflexota bacterium]
MASNLPNSSQRDTKRILVVDDEPRMIGFIRMNLELEGHQVIEAHNGLEALESVRTQLPDIVILDVMMPRMTGYEVTRKIRATRSRNELPIVLLTAKNLLEDEIVGLEA